MEPWVQRSHRAHLNLLEQFLPFATIVIIAHLLKVSTPITVWCPFLFFWLRVSIGMISGLTRLPVRPLLYVAGWLVTIVMAWQILAHAPPRGKALHVSQKLLIPRFSDQCRFVKILEICTVACSWRSVSS